jgi:hypothetical protein
MVVILVSLKRKFDRAWTLDFLLPSRASNPKSGGIFLISNFGAMIQLATRTAEAEG